MKTRKLQTVKFWKATQEFMSQNMSDYDE
jgi:hypothetical protein